MTKGGSSIKNRVESTEPIKDEELQLMEKILEGQTQRKSTVRASSNVIESSPNKGGGPIKDLNISDIDKNEEDDPNQLFSLR